MAEDQRIEQNRAVRNQLIDALQAAGLKVNSQYRISGDGFEADVSGRYIFDPISISVKPDYRVRRRGLHHATYRVRRGDDPTPAITKAVAKAKEFAAAVAEARTAEESAARRHKESGGKMREAARLTFPGFECSGTTRNGLFFTRDSDQCSVHLVCYDGVVKVEKVVFDPFRAMSLAEAQAITRTEQ